MTKTPIPGKVKTRLAASVGDQMACSIYEYLLKHTAEFCRRVDADRQVWYAPTLVADDAFSDADFHKTLQVEGDLGVKMQAAFQAAFAEGMERAVIIGSDCYDLTAERLTEAFAALEEHDVVLGPALDGGYYLLGLRQMVPQVFQDKPWSQAHLLATTTKELEQLGHSYALLPPLSDIDYLEDLPVAVRTHFGV